MLNDGRDPLTGLYSRQFLEDLLPREISRAQRHGNAVGLAALDLDAPARNPRSGWKPSDAELCEFGYLLQLRMRAEDVACRVGARNFVLIMPGITSAVLPRRMIELRATLERYYAEKTRRFRGGPVITLAIASFPEDGLTARGLMKTLRDALGRSRSTAGLAPASNPAVETGRII